MLRGEIDAASVGSVDALLETYAQVMQDAIEQIGIDTVIERTGIDRATIRAVRDGDVSSLALSDAAAILGAHPNRPDGETIAAEARDMLLLGMTTAVVDVDTLASNMDGQMEPKEIQQKIEGRHPMALGEYAAVHYHLREHVE
ncbi:MAG: DUF5791 family protein [Salinirussus sp.]